MLNPKQLGTQINSRQSGSNLVSDDRIQEKKIYESPIQLGVKQSPKQSGDNLESDDLMSEKNFNTSPTKVVNLQNVFTELLDELKLFNENFRLFSNASQRDDANKNLARKNYANDERNFAEGATHRNNPDVYYDEKYVDEIAVLKPVTMNHMPSKILSSSTCKLENSEKSNNVSTSKHKFQNAEYNGQDDPKLISNNGQGDPKLTSYNNGHDVQNLIAKVKGQTDQNSVKKINEQLGFDANDENDLLAAENADEITISRPAVMNHMVSKFSTLSVSENDFKHDKRSKNSNSRSNLTVSRRNKIPNVFVKKTNCEANQNIAKNYLKIYNVHRGTPRNPYSVDSQSDNSLNQSLNDCSESVSDQLDNCSDRNFSSDSYNSNDENCFHETYSQNQLNTLAPGVNIDENGEVYIYLGYSMTRSNQMISEITDYAVFLQNKVDEFYYEMSSLANSFY